MPFLDPLLEATVPLRRVESNMRLDAVTDGPAQLDLKQGNGSLTIRREDAKQ